MPGVMSTLVPLANSGVVSLLIVTFLSFHFSKSDSPSLVTAGKDFLSQQLSPQQHLKILFNLF